MRILLKKTLLSLTTIYIAGALLYLAAYLLTKDRLWPVAWLAIFAHWLLLPTLPLLLLCLWSKCQGRAVLLTLILMGYLVLYGDLFTPRLGQPTCAESCKRLRVMTLNVYYDLVPAETLHAAYRQSGADLILMQELATGPAQDLVGQLTDIYPYRALSLDTHFDNGLLSKYPIVEQEVLTANRSSLPYYTRFVVEVEGRRLTLINIHSAPPQFTKEDIFYHHRNLEVLQAVADIAASGQPVIVGGDLNAIDQSSDYALLRAAGLEDAFRAAGWGFGTSWPNNGTFSYKGFVPPSMIRIDYIFYSSHLIAERTWVGEFAGSDHLPVLADLLWVEK